MAFKAVTARCLNDIERGFIWHVGESQKIVSLDVDSTPCHPKKVFFQFTLINFSYNADLIEFWRARFYVMRSFFAHPNNQRNGEDLRSGSKDRKFHIYGAWEDNDLYIKIFQLPSYPPHFYTPRHLRFSGARFREVLEAMDKAQKIVEEHFILKNPK